MLDIALNDRICRVGPQTPMGRAMRLYWIPFAMCSDVERGADPRGIELLGEKFVAYRDAAGRVGLYAEGCLHRGASMLLARAEPDGLRCIYHGWKFAVDGQVLETPNVQDGRFKERIRGRTYPVKEAGGLLWAYLGPKEKQPAFPHYPWMDLPAAQRLPVVHYEECNYVQVIEGLVDSSHLGVLHMNGLKQSSGTSLAFAQKVSSMQHNLAPRLEVEETEFGFYYAALREITDSAGTRTEARVTAFIAPFIVLNPNGDIATFVVPMDDTRCAFIHVFWSETEALGEEPLRSRHLSFVGLAQEALEAFGLTRDTLGRHDLPHPSNNFMQDRAAMRAGDSWSGLPGLIEEDVGISVSSGPLRPRAAEMLSPADVAVARLYRALLAVADAAEAGQVLPALDARTDWRAVVGTHGLVTADFDWRRLVPGRAARGTLMETTS